MNVKQTVAHLVVRATTPIVLWHSKQNQENEHGV